MVQSELILPSIASSSTRCQKKHKANKELTTLSKTSLIFTRQKDHNSTALPSCFSSLYRTGRSNRSKLDQILPPPLSLPSLPAVVNRPTRHFTKDTLTKDGAATGSGHGLSLPKIKLSPTSKTSTKRGGHGHGISSSSLVLQGTSINTRQEPSVDSISSERSQIKLDFPDDIHKFQTGADICSVINLCMPFSCALRTSNINCHSQEFMPSETQVRRSCRTGLNVKKTSYIPCEWEQNNRNKMESQRKLPTTGGQLDHFNSALLQLSECVLRCYYYYLLLNRAGSV